MAKVRRHNQTNALVFAIPRFDGLVWPDLTRGVGSRIQYKRSAVRVVAVTKQLGEFLGFGGSQPINANAVTKSAPLKLLVDRFSNLWKNRTDHADLAGVANASALCGLRRYWASKSSDRSWKTPIWRSRTLNASKF